MVERTQGLILRTRPLTETSLIVHWLTPDFGRLATAAKGARRSNSVFRGKLDLFYLADFSFARSRRSELHTLREVSVREMHLPLRRDLANLRLASYSAALIEQATETETPLPRVFELFLALLDSLGQTGALPQFLFAFELKLLEELGLKADLAKSHLNPGSREIIHALEHRDWSTISRLKLSQSQLEEIGQFLHGFVLYHLGKIPRGRKIPD